MLPLRKYQTIGSILLAAAAAAYGQQVVAPTTETVGSARGDNVGNYNVTQSFETGYRWHLVGGNVGMYRSIDNYGNGLRVLGSNLTVNSRDGHGHYFDEIVLNTTGLGNDPYQAAILRIQRNQLYRYDMSWRLNDYYNPGLTVAGGNHFEDTVRRMQDHDLTLLPQSHTRFRVGYSREGEDGPALTTSQEFTTTGSGLPVFSNVKRQWNEYRLGADLEFHGFALTITRRWDFFKDDTPVSSAGAEAAGTATDSTVLQQFRRAQPVHGANPGWLGDLRTQRKRWAMNARATYVNGRRDFVLSELAQGLGQLGGPAIREIAVRGNAGRPVANGDLAVSFFPADKLTIVNNTSVTSNRIDGTANYSEAGTFATFKNIDFRYFGIRTVSNFTDLNYRVRNWFGVYAGYHYSDRLIKTIESSLLPGLDTSFNGQTYEVSNHLNTGRLGIRLRPAKTVTMSVDGEVGRAANPLTLTQDRNYHAINGRIDHRVRKFQFSAIYRQAYNLNSPVNFVSFDSHSRQYSASASYAATNWFTLDTSYSKLHLDTSSFLTFFASSTPRSQLQTNYLSIYRSNIHAANLTARFGIAKKADLFVGYAITKDTGDGRSVSSDPIQNLLNSVQTFPLTYESPLARISVRLSAKFRWNAGWQYYAYHEEFGLFGYNQNYRAHTGFTSVLWAF
jgi:hypothetical protein